MVALPVGTIPSTDEVNLSSLALVDTLSFADDVFRLTLGLRQQQVEQTKFSPTTGAVTAHADKKALTPALGMILKPWGDTISLYANYVEGLSKGMNFTKVNGYLQDQFTNSYKSEQKEVGAKWQAGTFTNTVSLFEIEQPTVVTSGSYGSYVASDDNEMRVRGLEWNTFGEIIPALRVLGGISYTKGTLLKTSSGANVGNEIFGVPRWQSNLGAEWDLPWVPGLSLNGRVISTSSLYLDNANTYKIPSWNQFDVGAAYRTRVAAKPLVLRLNVANLFDKHYWSGSFAEPRATLAQGRTVTASATMDF